MSYFVKKQNASKVTDSCTVQVNYYSSLQNLAFIYKTLVPRKTTEHYCITTGSSNAACKGQNTDVTERLGKYKKNAEWSAEMDRGHFLV